ncbi:hypothetical protein I3760_10G112000 [Carya illinoinensis]|uniref:BHLH domain-containing protein n=1 Tax=Carya illinoinensis TaxID=32201 RepID=A0A922DWZ0_CARIL|nr:hypothetical protein I3760_10G112000 [Carya illinoinensis]KAG6692410.1 hypothetical protein I3842_10G113400 [Carya illinoinensis]
MAEEFQTGVCGANWTMNSSRSLFTGGYMWPSDMVLDLKAGRSRDQETLDSVSAARTSLVLQDLQKPQQADSTSGSSASILSDSALQMMGFGFSSSSTTSDLNQALLRGGGTSENNYSSMLQEERMNSMLNYQQEKVVDSSQIQKNWIPKSFSNGSEVLTAYKSTIQDFPSDSGSNNITETFQGISTGFPASSASNYGYPTTFGQCLFDLESQTQQPLFNNRPIMNFNYPSNANYGTNSNEIISPSCPKFSTIYPKQQPCDLHSSNKTPFWNTFTAALAESIRPGLFPSSQSQYLAPTFGEKPKFSNLTVKPKVEDVLQDSVSVLAKKSGSEPVFKRPRIETPSPLPTFKVRKEKLGDRITALQQLVSPFGKTDTASVLHEAIDYIKFLHDQVGVLSTPYMKNGTPIQHQQGSDKLKDSSPDQDQNQDLRSRGLCLVPISSTYPVANETAADFWTPTFGSGAFG